MVDINNNDHVTNNHIINLFIENTMVVIKEFLKSRFVPYMGSVPISSEDYIKKSNSLAQEQIYNIMFTEVLLPLQQ